MIQSEKKKRMNKWRKLMWIIKHNQKKPFPHYWNPQGEEKEKGARGLFKEIMAKNFPNLGRKLTIQIH